MALKVEILTAYYDDYMADYMKANELPIFVDEHYFNDFVADMLPSYYEKEHGPYEDEPEYKDFIDQLTLRRKCFNEFLNGQMGYELRNDGHSVICVRKVFNMDYIDQQFNVLDIYRGYKECFAIIDCIVRTMKDGYATVHVRDSVEGEFLLWAKNTELEGKVRIVVLKEDFDTSEISLNKLTRLHGFSPAGEKSCCDHVTYIDELENSSKFTPENEKEEYEKYKKDIAPKEEVVQKYPTVIEIRRVCYEGLKLLTTNFVKYPTIDEMYEQMYEEFSGQNSMVHEALVLVYDIPDMPERFVYKNRKYLFRCFYYNYSKIYEMPTELALEKFHTLYKEMIEEQNENEERSDNIEQTDQ